jgi:4-amino-4-deoxy-L-arabinose transferase-like glycosyltransferase
VVAQLGLRPAFDVMELWNHADIVRALAVDWTVPGTALLAIFGWIRMGKRPHALPLRRFLVTVIGLFCLALLISVAGKDDGARPRYLSTALLPLAFLAGAGAIAAFDGLRERIGSRLAVVVAALVGVVLPSLQIAWVLDDRLPALTHRMDLYDAVAALGVPDAVVIVRVPYPTRLTRNGLFDESVLYVGVAPGRPAADVARAFPGRPLFEARERVNDHNSVVWDVTPVL